MEVAEAADRLLYYVVKAKVPFKNAIRNLESTLAAIKPLITENPQLNDQEEAEELRIFRHQIEKGVQLVHKCSQLRSWELCRRYKYTKKLVALDRSLEKVLDRLRSQVANDVVRSLASGNREHMIREIEARCEVPELPTVIVGLDEPLKELKSKLLKDAEVSMVILTAPGGCGKTTLAAKFCNDQQVKDTFKDNIFFVRVSKKPDLRLIVLQLFGHKGLSAPTFENEENITVWFHLFMESEGRKQMPLLVVLDDVWSGSESLVEQFHSMKMPNYKILVTSRNEFPRFSSRYYLKSFNNEEAMTLFQAISITDGSYDIPEKLQRKMAESCKGIPLAIVVVGKSLAGQPVEVWKEREMRLSKGNSTLDSETAVLKNLRSSLDVLGEKNYILKELFIDLASFPEDRIIAAVGLIDMWSELYELDEDFLSIAHLYQLNTRGLANLVVTRRPEVDGYYSEHFVTQHGILRDLAIYETRRDLLGQTKRLIIDICGHDPPKWWTEQKDKPKKTRLLSISTDEMFTTKWPIMQLPKPEVLILNFQTNYALPNFLKKMYKSLKVLIVSNYGSLPAELSNFDQLGSLSNLKRIRLEGISVPSIQTKMMSLRKMSFFMCYISQALNGGTIRLSDALPNLEEMNIDYCRDLITLPEGLCDLIQLKKLSITNCHKLAALPEWIGMLVNLEVLRLRSCTDLVILPDSISDLKKLKLLDISHCFSIEELPEQIGEMSSLRQLNIRECSRLLEVPESVANLTELEVICDDQTKDMWESFYVKIRVVKKEFDLNWLHVPTF